MTRFAQSREVAQQHGSYWMDLVGKAERALDKFYKAYGRAPDIQALIKVYVDQGYRPDVARQKARTDVLCMRYENLDQAREIAQAINEVAETLDRKTRTPEPKADDSARLLIRNELDTLLHGKSGGDALEAAVRAALAHDDYFRELASRYGEVLAVKHDVPNLKEVIVRMWEDNQQGAAFQVKRSLYKEHFGGYAAKGFIEGNINFSIDAAASRVGMTFDDE
jgi:hypothetical protein